MVKKKIAKRMAFVAASAAFAAVVVAQPASAAQVSAYYQGTHAAVDNSPGNGSAGWVWVYGSTQGTALSGSIDYRLWDGSSGSLTARTGQTQSRNTNSDIREFRACTNRTIDSFPVSSCGAWVSFG